jgi:hypothetical protein
MKLLASTLLALFLAATTVSANMGSVYCDKSPWDVRNTSSSHDMLPLTAEVPFFWFHQGGNCAPADSEQCPGRCKASVCRPLRKSLGNLWRCLLLMITTVQGNGYV